MSAIENGMFVGRRTLAHLAKVEPGRVDTALGKLGTAMWQVATDGEQVVPASVARDALADLLPRGGKASANRLLAPHLSANHESVSAVARANGTSTASVRGSLSNFSLTSVYVQRGSRIDPRVGTGELGTRQASKGVELVQAAAKPKVRELTSGSGAPSPVARTNGRPAAAAKTPAATRRGGSKAKALPAAPTAAAPVAAAPPKPSRAPKSASQEPAAQAGRRALLVRGGIGATVLGGAGMLGQRLLQRQGSEAAAGGADSSTSGGGGAAKTINADTDRVQRALTSLDEGSAEGKRTKIALRALAEADRALTIQPNGKLDDRVAEYMKATDGVTPDAERAWSGDFAAWVSKPLAPLGYGGKGGKTAADIAEWAENAGAFHKKADAKPQVGDLVALNTVADDQAIDTLAVVTSVDGDKFTVVQGAVNSSQEATRAQVRRVQYETGDESVVGFIDPTAAKAMDAPPEKPKKIDIPMPNIKITPDPPTSEKPADPAPAPPPAQPPAPAPPAPAPPAPSVRDKIVGALVGEWKKDVVEDAAPDEDLAGHIRGYRQAVLNPAFGGPNRGPEAWCADFASWVWRQAGTPFGAGGQGDASTNNIVRFAKANGMWKADDPQPGDMVLFDWGQARGKGMDEQVVDHVAIVEKTQPGFVTVIGGNQIRRDKREGVSEVTYALDDLNILGYVKPPGT